MRKTLFIFGWIFLVAGYLFLWWPLTLLAITCFILDDAWFLSLLIAVGADLLWGRPTGMFHTILFPWTLLCSAALILRYIVLQQIRAHMPEYL